MPAEGTKPVNSLAHACFRWRRAVIGAWLLVLVALSVLTVSVGPAFTDDVELPGSESATAHSLLPSTDATTMQGRIVWHTDGVAIDDSTVRERVAAVLTEIKGLPGVESVVSPYEKAGATQLDQDSSTAYATVVLAEDAATEPVVTAVEKLASDQLEVATGGDVFSETPSPGSVTEILGVLVALLILFLMFRSGWAAALPIITGVVGVSASMLLIVSGTHVVDLTATSLSMGSLIGLGVGIDYALFIVNRHRKALLAGATVPEAIRQAVTTSGRAVVFAGATVIIALLGMFVVGLGILTAMAQAAAVTVAFTVLAAITLLPALLGVLGDRVLSRRQRRGTALPAARHTTGRAARWAAVVQRAPIPLALAATVVIAALAFPVTQMRVGDSDASSAPAGSAPREYHDLMSAGFGPGFDATLLLVARTPDDGKSEAFARFAASLTSMPDVAAVQIPPAQPGAPVALATVTPATSAQDEKTTELVAALRDKIHSDSGLEVYVGGAAASSIDLADTLMNRLPLYLGLIVVLGYLLLAVAFRSLLVPLVGALSNLAMILVGLGAITVIFQLGWGSELLGVGGEAPVMYLVPILIVGVMFGLSMDYQVFLVSRMHEEWTHTGDNRRAVRVGVTETGQVIVTAATIMFSVFVSFGLSGERIMAMNGIGLAIAVLVDAFLVRLTLVPALMTVIGRANWHYPRGLDRITPRVSVEGPACEPADSEDREALALQR